MDIFFCLGHLPPFHPLQSLWIIPRNGPSTYPDSLACPVAAALTLCFLWALCRLSSHPPLPLPIKIFIHLGLDDPISQVYSGMLFLPWFILWKERFHKFHQSHKVTFISCFIFGHRPCHIYIYVYISFPQASNPMAPPSIHSSLISSGHPKYHFLQVSNHVHSPSVSLRVSIGW